MGSPIFVMGSIVHLRSHALARTILKIFCTLIDECAEQKMSGAFIAFANLRACCYPNQVKEG